MTEHRTSCALCLCAYWFVSTFYVPSCLSRSPEVVFYIHDGYTFSTSEQQTIRTVAETAAHDARFLLPDLPPHLIVRVNPGKKVINEIGSSSGTSTPNVVYWTVDPSMPEGVSQIAHLHLRATLFHHFHRLARLRHRSDVTLMDHVVSLGMATAFERDAGGRSYPWGQYPDEVRAWVEELRALPANANLNHWMYRHPDGRRWVGIRAGTYLADRAKNASGKSAAELIAFSTAEVLHLALQATGTSPAAPRAPVK